MNFLPLIFQEINFVTEEYITLLSKIRQKESEKESKKNQKAENKNIEQTDREFKMKIMKKMRMKTKKIMMKN